ncbi:integrase catalytic domain-containing protein [Trichonephila clavipes]|nr:integrase catalytic domain-containing protein [Trichonephila clavipes]
MGGLWEAGIKSVKYHLKRALGRSRLTYEEFETVIIQVEGILNSRPLTPISNDFDNFERGKWMIEKDNVMCSTMVIVKEDFTPVCNWLLGRVVEVYHGSDGKGEIPSANGGLRMADCLSNGEAAFHVCVGLTSVPVMVPSPCTGSEASRVRTGQWGSPIGSWV